MRDSDRPSVMDATGGDPHVSPKPPASFVGWAMEKPWEMPAGSARAPAAAKIPTVRRGAVAPLPLPAPSEGKLSPAPLLSRPFLRAGQEGAARPPPAPPYLLPSPLPPAPGLASRCRAGGGCDAKPTGVPVSWGSRHRGAPYPSRTVDHGLPKRDHEALALAMPPLHPPPHLPSAERVICILYVKEILLSPSPSPSLFW